MGGKEVPKTERRLALAAFLPFGAGMLALVIAAGIDAFLVPAPMSVRRVIFIVACGVFVTVSLPALFAFVHASDKRLREESKDGNSEIA